MAEHDLVDIAGRNAGIRQRLIGDADDEALDGLGVELAERRVRPSNDAGGHGHSPASAANGSGDELTTQFVLDVNPDDVVKSLFGGGEAELDGPLGVEIAWPAVDDAHDEGIRLALDAGGHLVAGHALQ